MWRAANRMSIMQAGLKSVCVFCGSSAAAPPAWLEAARRLGEILAGQAIRLVYGGGGIGLMGACARGAHESGGAVLGVIPRFLVGREHPIVGVETAVVGSMHARKIRMFEEADGFIVLPGAIGTLEEAVEVLSWRRLGLHAKPVVFFDPDRFWAPLLAQFQAFVDQQLAPEPFLRCFAAVDAVEDILPALRGLPADLAVDHYFAARS
jgi:uncharacterized protein (TIGR00730 family)